jgi:hypothetical protein
MESLAEWTRRQAEVSVAVPTEGDVRAQDFDAAEEAGCSVGGGSTAVVSNRPICSGIEFGTRQVWVTVLLSACHQVTIVAW